LFATTQVFLRFCNRQQQKRAKPPLGTTGVPTFLVSAPRQVRLGLTGSPREGKGVGTWVSFDSVRRFIRGHVTQEVTFPLSRASIDSVVEIIFGEVDELLIQNFEKNLLQFHNDSNEDTNEEENDTEMNDNQPISSDIGKLIAGEPFSIVKFILRRQNLYVSSRFLDVNATDMKSMKGLTLPWIRRITGLLLKHVTQPHETKVLYRVDAENWETVIAEALYPECEFIKKSFWSLF
jgi:hypothetical protein